MNKLSSTKLSALLSESAAALRRMAEERDAAQDKVAAMELRDRCMKLAQAMHSKGINSDRSIEELTDWHVKHASSGGVNLEVVEQAVAMQGHDLTQKIGHLASESPGGESSLGRYLNSLVGSVG